jgi:hypothetical protein
VPNRQGRGGEWWSILIPRDTFFGAETGALADPVVADRVNLRPTTEPPFRTAPGPSANEQTRRPRGWYRTHRSRGARRDPRAPRHAGLRGCIAMSGVAPTRDTTQAPPNGPATSARKRLLVPMDPNVASPKPAADAA